MSENPLRKVYRNTHQLVEMVNITVALFARFRVNGIIDLIAPQLSVVGIISLKLGDKSEAHPKMPYIGNTPPNPVFIENFSDEYLVAV